MGGKNKLKKQNKWEEERNDAKEELTGVTASGYTKLGRATWLMR
jgi:hypothetical protein